MRCYHTHSDLGNFDIPKPKPEDHKISTSIQKYWTNMAKYGTPNGPVAAATTAYTAIDYAEVQWPKYTLLTATLS
jgi:hypothetical protein